MWTSKPLAEIAEFRLGKMLDARKNRGELLPYLANVNVRWGEFVLEDLREMRFEDRELDRFGLRAGDIVMCEGGEPGRCAIWKDAVPGMMYQKALHRIRVRGSVDHRFVYYSLLHTGRRGGFTPLLTGATIKHLPREKLALLEVAIPPLAVQRRIGDTLTAYDDLIENNRRRMALLENAARQLYREWFVRLRFPGHEHTPRHEGVPRGWKRVATPDAVEINPKTRLSAEEEHWYVEMADLPTDSMVVQRARLRAGRSGSKFQNDDVLLARITPCLENGKTAFVTFLPEGEAGFGSTEFIVLRGKRVPPEFVYCLARTESFREHAIKSMIGASGRQRVQESCFDKYPVWVPDHIVLELFSDAVRPMFRQIAVLHAQNQKLRAARDLLLPRLMSGEITV